MDYWGALFQQQTDTDYILLILLLYTGASVVVYTGPGTGWAR